MAVGGGVEPPRPYQGSAVFKTVAVANLLALPRIKIFEFKLKLIYPQEGELEKNTEK